MLGLLLDVCYTVPMLMYVLWKVMRVTAIDYGVWTVSICTGVTMMEVLLQ